jgi:hypothetical protein
MPCAASWPFPALPQQQQQPQALQLQHLRTAPLLLLELPLLCRQLRGLQVLAATAATQQRGQAA